MVSKLCPAVTGGWGEGRPSRSVFLLQILPSASPYLVCPPGVLGRWAWMAVLGLLSSQPVPGTRRSSLAANQKSGEKGGIRVSPEDGRGLSFLQLWLRASGDRLITIHPPGGGGQAARGWGQAFPSSSFKQASPLRLPPMPVTPGTPSAQSLAYHQLANKKTLSPPGPVTSPPTVIPERSLGIIFDIFFLSPTPLITKVPILFP